MPDLGSIPNNIVAAVVVAWFGLQMMDRMSTFMGRNGKHTNGNSGERSPEFWKTEIRLATSESLKPFADFIERQTELLSKIESNIQRHTELLLKAEYKTDEIKEGQAHLRTGMHDLRESVNIAIGRRTP